MLSSNSRSGSSEMAQKNSPSAPVAKFAPSKSTKGSPVSSDSSASKSFKILDRKPSTKSASSPEKRIVRVSEMQKQLSQLQEELKKEKEEKAQAVEELMEVRKSLSSQNKANVGWTRSKSKVEVLEKEVEKAKESEREMLESLVSQTKQLEQTKIALEEANLEIKSLQESIKRLEGSAVSASRSSRNLGKHLERPGVLHVAYAEEEIRVLKNELKLATEAEEKSKKAMDDLAIALKEVTMEANQVKESLSISQSELESITREAEQSKASLKSMEEKFRLVSEESERLKIEAEESMAAWNAKENGFVDCIKISEEEISRAKQENSRLIESQREAREENSKLRDLLKQAVSEATVVKEALEIARNENTQLKDLLSQEENALQRIMQEYDSLKVSEAAAVDSVKELKNLLAATSTVESQYPSFVETGSFRQPKTIVTDVSGRKDGNPHKQNGRRHSIGEPGKFKGSMFDMAGSPEPKDRIFSSLSNVSDMRATSSMVMDDGDTLNSDDFDYIDRSQLDGMDHFPTKQKKKKPILRRFGDLLKRKSSHK